MLQSANLWTQLHNFIFSPENGRLKTKMHAPTICDRQKVRPTSVRQAILLVYCSVLVVVNIGARLVLDLEVVYDPRTSSAIPTNTD